ncbi:MAG: TetR/AcrR family transcriptional regulator [Myxococcota bacterium]
MAPPARRSGTRKKSRSAHQGELRAALITEAERELDEVGVNKLSLRSIARRAGVSEAAPYHHFEGKDDLLQAVAVAGFERLFDRFAAVSRQSPGWDHLGGIGVVYVQFALEFPAMFRLMFGSVAGENIRRADFERARSRVFDVLNESVDRYLAEQGVPACEASTLATVAWATVHGLATLLVEKELDPVELGFDDAQALVERVLASIAFVPEPAG